MGKIIMTADDSASIRQMVSFTLKQNGYDVVEAVDGQDALSKLATNKVDMLLTDLIVRKAQQNGSTPEQELQHMMEHDHMSAWMQEIRRNQALGLLLAEATVTDEAGAVVDVKPEVITEAEDDVEDEADAAVEDEVEKA